MFGESFDCPGAVSFADLEAKEAQRFSRLLTEVENRLYTTVGADVGNEVATVSENTRQYYSEGYDANYERVSDREIMQWQNTSLPNMVYLRVEGHAMNLLKLIGNDYNDAFSTCDDVPNATNFVEDLASIGKLNDDLFICGKAIVAPQGFTPSLSLTTEDESEYLAVHGILQEYIEYSGGQLSLDNDETGVDNKQRIVDPQDSQKEEVLSSMVDAIWPDIVDALKPLISDVLNAARDNNIPYKVDQTPPVDECGGDGFDFASDSEW